MRPVLRGRDKEGRQGKFLASAPSFEGEKLLEADAFETLWIEMPPLSTGIHPVTVKALRGPFHRYANQEITVYDSYLRKG